MLAKPTVQRRLCSETRCLQSQLMALHYEFWKWLHDNYFKRERRLLPAFVSPPRKRICFTLKRLIIFKTGLDLFKKEMVLLKRWLLDEVGKGIMKTSMKVIE